MPSPRPLWLALLSAETPVTGMTFMRSTGQGETAMSPELMAPAAWVTSSREAAVQSRALLRETHSLIARNRRRMNPWWGVSGSSDPNGDDDLRLSVRDRLQRGILPPAPRQVWAGKGTGTTCAICAITIGPDQVENEIAIRSNGTVVTLWAHLHCLEIWWREVETLPEANGRPSGPDFSAQPA